MSDDAEFVPSPAPSGLRAGGRTLWDGIAGSFELLPEQLVQLEEACRAKDRLDEFDRIIAGKGVLELMRFRCREAFRDDEDDRHLSVEVRFDSVISQANATANQMKQMLAALRLPDQDGRRPQYRGARGSQAPSVPGGAEKKGKSASERAASRWGA